jgi:hypothetical protein
MKHFIYLDAENRVIEKMSVPANTPLLEKKGLLCVEVESDVPLNTVYGDTAETPISLFTEEADYRKKRRSAYPSVQEQLDMLWKAMNENTLPRAEPFYSTIKGVKDLYPKTAQSQVENTVIL